MLQMGVLEKIPQQGGITVKELAIAIQKNEEVLSTSSVAVQLAPEYMLQLAET
jgi:hypothetical protein